MKEKLPINAKILKWARTSLGFSIQEVASKVGKSDEEIQSWELGESTPTYATLEKLAYQIYKRPIALFFFPEIPQEDSLETEFRTLPNLIIEHLPVEIVRLYRKAKVFQIYLSELYENQKPIPKGIIDIFSLDNNTDLVLLAFELRKYLQIPLDDQLSWRSTDIAFTKWRNAVEKKGIFIFKDAFHNDDFSGFCIYHEKYPIIYVNNSLPESRQIFTIFHELGHLLRHVGGIDFRDRKYIDLLEGKYSSVEMMCNKFAAEFLVPANFFRSLHLKVDEEYFESLSIRFSVSREVILRKYFEMGKISQDYYEKLSRKWVQQAIQQKGKKGGGDYYLNKRAYLGKNYINFVFEKYYKNKISIENLANYLNIKVNHVGNLEHYVSG